MAQDQLAELIFTKEKETKNTVRFQEQPTEDKPLLIGTLYVQKWWVRGAEKLTVTLKK